MAAYNKSPSVTLLEQDRSAYVVTTANTILCIVGYATKGPINTVKSITSKSSFLKTFGPPSSTAPWSNMAVQRALNQTNQVLFYRVANLAYGGDSLLQAGFAERVIKTYGDSNKVLFQTYEKGTALNANLYLTVTQRLDPVKGDSRFDLRVYYAGDLQETFVGISFASGDTNFFATKINTDITNGGSAWMSVATKQRGTSIFRLIPAGSASGTVSTFYFGVNPTSVSDSLSGDSRKFKSGIGDTFSAEYGDSTAYDYRIGKDGIYSGDTIFVNALSTSGALANKELWDFHILSVPDNSDSAVADAGVALAEYRNDFLFLVDPPFGKTVDNVVNWHNGVGSQGRSSPLNSSYAATWWPWLKDYNQQAGQYVWVPPSVFIGELLLNVDRNFAPWYAPAGDIRGKITAYDYEVSPSQADREQLYGDLNAVNPIVNFNIKGLEVYGQKTLLRQTTALNRLNVRRMIIYVKKLIKKAMDSIVFEPDNADSWSRARTIINSILEPVRQQNGLADYKVTIDDTTNTPDLIAQQIMTGIIQLIPVGAIEIIQLTVQVRPPGSTIV